MYVPNSAYPACSKVQGLESDGSFTRGFIATACLSAFQEQRVPSSPKQFKRVLRHALQGGAALAAGTHAAIAVKQGNYLGAVLATALGAASVLAVERLLQESSTSAPELINGQEA